MRARPYACRVVLKEKTGAEADRLLDELEARLGLRGYRLSAGRRFDFADRWEWDPVGAKEEIAALLGQVSPDWRRHLDVK